jgi:protein arginine N-methyltransferase 6
MKRPRPEFSEADAVYFATYDSAFVHEEMLRDPVRCQAFADGVDINRAAINGGVVIDVGAGSGILSCMCARAGARKVYAIEASASAAELCRAVVKQNGFEGVIEVIEGRVEDTELSLGHGCADVIISEWMGCMLLYESMLDSVLLARDRWLRPGGLMLPSSARIFLCPFSDSEWRRDRAAHLRSVCGVDCSPVVQRLAAEESTEPSVTGVDPDQLIGSPQLALELDLAAVTVEEIQSATAALSFSDFDGLDHGGRVVDGFAGWFDVSFERPLAHEPPLSSRFAPASTPSPAPAESSSELPSESPPAATAAATADLAAAGAGADAAAAAVAFRTAPLGKPVARRVVLSTAPASPRSK